MNDLASLIYGSQGMPPAQPYPVAPVPQPAGMPLPEAAVPVVQNVAAPVVQAAPAAAPAPLTENSSPQEKSDFFTRMRTDPNLAQSVLMTGLTMMQPQSGENTMGLVGRSIMAGNMTKNFLDQNVVEEDRKAAESASQQDYRNTQTASLKQKTAQDAELFPETKRKLGLDIDNAVTDGQKKRAEAAMKEFDAEPGRMAEKYNLDRSATRANINQSNAAAGASGASAKASNALTDERKFGLGIKQEAFSDKTTAERKATIRQGYTMDDQAANAIGAKSDELTRLVKAANPKMTDQEVASEVLQRSGEAKSNFLSAAIKVLDNPEQYDEATVAAAQRMVGDAFKGKTTKGAAAAPAAPIPGVPPMGSRVVGKTTWTNPNGVTGVWNGTGWDVKK